MTSDVVCTPRDIDIDICLAMERLTLLNQSYETSYSVVYQEFTSLH